MPTIKSNRNNEKEHFACYDVKRFACSHFLNQTPIRPYEMFLRGKSTTIVLLTTRRSRVRSPPLAECSTFTLLYPSRIYVIGALSALLRPRDWTISRETFLNESQGDILSIIAMRLDRSDRRHRLITKIQTNLRRRSLRGH